MIATTSTQEKADLAKENGAHHVLLTTTSSEENIKTIKDLTDGKGVHVVYDGVGKDTFDEDFEVVRPKGTLVMYGNASVSSSMQLVSWSGIIRRSDADTRTGCTSRVLGSQTHAEEFEDHPTDFGCVHQQS